MNWYLARWGVIQADAVFFFWLVEESLKPALYDKACPDFSRAENQKSAIVSQRTALIEIYVKVIESKSILQVFKRTMVFHSGTVCKREDEHKDREESPQTYMHV